MGKHIEPMIQKPDTTRCYVCIQLSGVADTPEPYKTDSAFEAATRCINSEILSAPVYKTLDAAKTFAADELGWIGIYETVVPSNYITNTSNEELSFTPSAKIEPRDIVQLHLLENTLGKPHPECVIGNSLFVDPTTRADKKTATISHTPTASSSRIRPQ